MNKPSLNVRRGILAALALLSVLCVTNYYLDLHVFGRFNKQVMIASMALVLLVWMYIGPHINEIREYRENKHKS